MTPAAAARTGSPAEAARSTPRCPAAHGAGGASNRRSNPAAAPTGHARPGPAAAVPIVIAGADRPAARAAGGGISAKSTVASTSASRAASRRPSGVGGGTHTERSDHTVCRGRSGGATIAATARQREAKPEAQSEAKREPQREAKREPQPEAKPEARRTTRSRVEQGVMPERLRRPASSSHPSSESCGQPRGCGQPTGQIIVTEHPAEKHRVAGRSALPVHFTRDPVRRVDFARPATGESVREPAPLRARFATRPVRVPLGPPEPGAAQPPWPKRLGTSGRQA